MNPLILWRRFRMWLRVSRLRAARARRRRERSQAKRLAWLLDDSAWAYTVPEMTGYTYKSTTWSTHDAEGNLVDSGEGEPPFKVPKTPKPKQPKPRKKDDWPEIIE